MRKIRVLVANQPRLMRDLVVNTISEQSDIEIVGVLEDEPSIDGTVERLRPDVLIVTLDRTEDRPHICDVLLERFPQMRILALAAERNSTMFYWASLDIRSNRIENSEASVLSALRGRKLMVSTAPEPDSKSRTN